MFHGVLHLETKREGTTHTVKEENSPDVYFV